MTLKSPSSPKDIFFPQISVALVCQVFGLPSDRFVLSVLVFNKDLAWIQFVHICHMGWNHFLVDMPKHVTPKNGFCHFVLERCLLQNLIRNKILLDRFGAINFITFRGLNMMIILVFFLVMFNGCIHPKPCTVGHHHLDGEKALPNSIHDDHVNWCMVGFFNEMTCTSFSTVFFWWIFLLQSATPFRIPTTVPISPCAQKFIFPCKTNNSIPFADVLNKYGCILLGKWSNLRFLLVVFFCLQNEAETNKYN